MYEWLLVVLLHATGSNSTLTMERFATPEGCLTVKRYVEAKANADTSECFKVLKLKESNVSKE